jgi:hypothetical protein
MMYLSGIFGLSPVGRYLSYERENGAGRGMGWGKRGRNDPNIVGIYE